MCKQKTTQDWILPFEMTCSLRLSNLNIRTSNFVYEYGSARIFKGNLQSPATITMKPATVMSCKKSPVSTYKYCLVIFRVESPTWPKAMGSGHSSKARPSDPIHPWKYAQPTRSGRGVEPTHLLNTLQNFDNRNVWLFLKPYKSIPSCGRFYKGVCHQPKAGNFKQHEDTKQSFVLQV